MNHLELTGIIAAVLCLGVASFQIALALGLPLGEATFGGRATTTDGVLSRRFRAIAAVSAIALVGFAWVFLARTGVVSSGYVGDGVVSGATWVIVGFLLLNTIGNLAASHPLERWGMGSITLGLVILGGVIALRA